MPDTALCNSIYLWVFPQPQVFYLYMCFDQYCTKHLSRMLWKSSGPSLYAPFSSLVLCPAISSCLDFPRHSALSPLSETIRFCRRSPFCTTACKPSQNDKLWQSKVLLHLFHLSRLAIFRGLISSYLNIVVSHILFRFCGCFRWEYKPSPSYSILPRSGNMILPL